MIKLKKEKAEKAAALAAREAGAKTTKQLQPGMIRMQKDMSELRLDAGCTLDFHNGKDDLMNFKLTVKVDDGIYRNGKFVFDFKIPTSYPHEAPKVTCETTVYHPNLDMEGHVCLNILREDWKPVLTVQSVIMGLQFLMLEPNADDPLNKEAAQLLSSDRARFESTVRQTFKGRAMQVCGKTYSFPKFV